MLPLSVYCWNLMVLLLLSLFDTNDKRDTHADWVHLLGKGNTPHLTVLPSLALWNPPLYLCFIFFCIVPFVVFLPFRMCFLLYFSEVAPLVNVLSFIAVISNPSLICSHSSLSIVFLHETFVKPLDFYSLSFSFH